MANKWTYFWTHTLMYSHNYNTIINVDTKFYHSGVSAISDRCKNILHIDGLMNARLILTLDWQCLCIICIYLLVVNICQLLLV